jgi:hypothetical protein
MYYYHFYYNYLHIIIVVYAIVQNIFMTISIYVEYYQPLMFMCMSVYIIM